MTSNRPKQKLLILYLEIAGYVVSCIRYLVEHYEVEVHLVRYPLNKEAPFDFDFPTGCHVYTSSDYSPAQLVALAKDIDPDMLFCSGWVDKGYLKVCDAFHKSIPVLLAMDNHYKGTMRQKLATWLSGFFLHKRFTHAFVPGIYQFEFARRLGFPKDRILLGMYSADVELFDQQYRTRKAAQLKTVPKVFLYVGRYLPIKGTPDLWDAFQAFCQEHPDSEWELWCVGTGDLLPQFPQHPKIKDFGFVQPKELAKFITDAGVFVMPSRSDAWGVAIHEFAAAGMPIICSNVAGAAPAYVKSGYNGYVFEGSNVRSLQQALTKMSQHTDEELLVMQDRSNELSKQIKPATWAAAIMQVMES